MVIEIKFIGEQPTTVICELCENKGSFYVLKKAFINNEIYDNIIAERDRIEWIRQAGNSSSFPLD